MFYRTCVRSAGGGPSKKSAEVNPNDEACPRAVVNSDPVRERQAGGLASIWWSVRLWQPAQARTTGVDGSCRVFICAIAVCVMHGGHCEAVGEWAAMSAVPFQARASPPGSS